MSAEPILMPLRPDLEIYPGPPEADGRPTYNIHDPQTGQYHKVGWAEEAVLRMLRVPQALSTVARNVRRWVALEATDEEVLQLYRSAQQKGLVVGASVKPVAQLMEEVRRRRMHPLRKLFMSYLYFRLPLLRPDRFLARYLPWVRLLGGTPILVLYALVVGAGLVMLSQKWAHFRQDFFYSLTWGNLVYYGLAIAFIKAGHEFAHAFTAKRFGVRVPTMGVAFMVMAPVPYCDVTDSWKLKSRRQRLWIGLAGIVAETAVAGLSLFLWGIAPEGVWKFLFFILSCTTLLSTILVNINPAMRFDGYYILSDLWGIDNLQPRAFAVTKWAYRRYLLGMAMPCPESSLSRRRLIGMIVYSVYSWTYRVGLFIGIALLIYHRFTKLIGALLFVTEIGMFLVRPVVNEFVQLNNERRFLKLNPRLVATLAILLAAFLWFALPLERRITLPAVIQPVESQFLYAPEAGRVEKLRIERGAGVEAGAPLLEIRSATRQAEIDLARLDLARLRHALRCCQLGRGEREDLLRTQRQIDTARARLEGLLQRRARNRLHAEIDGRVIDWDETVREGQYIMPRTVFGVIADPGRIEALAFVHERHVEELDAGDEVTFWPRGDARALPGRVTLTTPVRAEELTYMALAAQAHGELPTVRDEAGRQTLVESYYVVHVELPTENPELLLWGSGWIHARTAPRSRLEDLLRYIHRVLLKESGL